jgi:hypothetical protein
VEVLFSLHSFNFAAELQLFFCIAGLFSGGTTNLTDDLTGLGTTQHSTILLEPFVYIPKSHQHAELTIIKNTSYMHAN